MRCRSIQHDYAPGVPGRITADRNDRHAASGQPSTQGYRGAADDENLRLPIDLPRGFLSVDDKRSALQELARFIVRTQDRSRYEGHDLVRRVGPNNDVLRRSPQIVAKLLRLLLTVAEEHLRCQRWLGASRVLLPELLDA